MWLHIPPATKSQPSVSSPEPGCSTSQLNLHAARSSVQSLTSNARPTLLRSLQQQWARGGFIQLLSGLTLEPFAAHNSAITFGRASGPNASGPSLRDTPARISPLPVSGKVREALRDRYGGTSLRRLQNSNPNSCFWKTWEATLLGASIPYAVRFKRWVTALRADSLRRQKRAQAIAANGCSLWLTSTKADAHGSRNRTLYRGSESNHHDGVTLNDEVQNWKTPTDPMKAETWATPNVPNGGRAMSAEDVSSKGATENGKRQVPLEAQTKQWAAPRAITGGGESGQRKQELGRDDSGGGDLQAQSQNWPTPMAQDCEQAGSKAKDYRTPNTAESQGRRNQGSKRGQQLQNFIKHNCLSSLPGPATSTPGEKSSKSTRRLNPRFVEWLMGWPRGHAACDCPATAWSHWKRRMHTSLSRLICSTRDPDSEPEPTGATK